MSGELEARLRSHLSVADDVAVPDTATVVATATGIARRRRRRRVLATGAAVLVSAVGGTVWLSGSRPDSRQVATEASATPTATAAAATPPAPAIDENAWATISPDPRGSTIEPQVVWTGSEVIAIGGHDPGSPAVRSQAVAYVPATDAWRLLAEPPHDVIDGVVAWTGSHVLAIGGTLADGGNLKPQALAYDPATDEWSAIAAPPLRYITADSPWVWTGEELLVWPWHDGHPEIVPLSYSPVTDSWEALATPPVEPRRNAASVWTGAEWLVWGGSGADGELADGAAYDPSTGRWRGLPPGPLGPRRVEGVWTGEELLIIAGSTGGDESGQGVFALSDGAGYDPQTNAWTPITPGFAHPGFVSEWTGEHVVLFAKGSAVVYEPATDTWIDTCCSAPGGGGGGTPVWTGSEIVLIGDFDDRIGGHTFMPPGTAAAPPSAPRSTVPATSTPAADPSTVERVVPYGARSDFLPFIAAAADTDVRTDNGAAGDVVLTYELQLGFDPAGRSGIVETATETTNGQLSIDVACPEDECRFEPVNDLIQTRLQLTVRRTNEPLNVGEHEASFALRFDDGAVEPFSVLFLADPGAIDPPAIPTTTGPPTPIQVVPDVGRFAYDAISAFDSIWILGKNSGTVTRLDAATGERLATVSIGAEGRTVNRLTATAGAVYATADEVARIDPTDNSVTTITLDPGVDSEPAAIASDGSTVWTADFDGPVHRIDADGTIERLATPDGRWFDLAVADGTVWVVSQERSGSRLLAFDAVTGEVVHDVVIAEADAHVPVRLAADGREIVVGVDTSGGGGRSGELLFIDPATATTTGSVELPARPEGIALTDDYVWTSGAVVDRTAWNVVDDTSIGFVLARGPDGSIWGTSGVPGSNTAESTAIRFDPGSFGG